MRALSQLPRLVLLLEVVGIAMLVASAFALRERLPWPLSGKPAAKALLFAGTALMLPAVSVMLLRCIRIVAPHCLTRVHCVINPHQEILMTPTIELLRSHRSIRSFSDEKITAEQRAAIIDAAQSASTSSFCSALRLYASATALCVTHWLN